MPTTLGTTNLFLGVIAVVSLLEAAVIVGLGVLAFITFRRALREIRRIDEQQLTPALGRVNAILDDVKDVTATVKQETGRVDGFVWMAVSAIRALFNEHAREHRHYDRPM